MNTQHNRKSNRKTRRYRGGQFNQPNWGSTQVNTNEQKAERYGPYLLFGGLMLPVAAGIIYAIAKK